MVKKKQASPKKKAAKPGSTRDRSRAKPASETGKKPASKSTTKNSVAKKTSKRGPALKSHQPAKKTSPASAHPKSAATKTHKTKPEDNASEETQHPSPEQLRKQIVAKARGGAKPQRATAFTLDDVRGELARATPSKSELPTPETPVEEEAQPVKKAALAPAPAIGAVVEQQHFEPASLADILGYNPNNNERPVDEESQIDKRFIRFYKLLIELRDHVNSGLQTHAEETLKRSSREDSGDLSGYGQHMADAGTDNFDRDFALSLVSNEQEALYEIEEAINRIKKGTYGICENTGKPISKDRLLAVPFARYSLESQAEIEKNQRRSSQRGGVFGDASGEEGAKFLEDDSE